MQCTLLVPHLFWPRDSADAVQGDLELPALKKIVARSTAHRAPALTLEAWLCQAFEVERQQDWPIAPLTLALDGGDVGERYWLRADPVHIKIERDRLLLVDTALFDVSSDEAKAFTAVLNEHLGDDALFEARAPKRWYMGVPKAPSLVTRNPDEAAGHDIKHYLPSGSDSMRWHRLFNEAQMVLHEHPLNEAREARGEPAINSVWFWGGGIRPRVHGTHFSAVWSDEAVAAALGAAADIPTRAAPADARAWLGSLEAFRRDASHLIVLNELANATRYGDIDAWRTRTATLDAHWLQPLSLALREGRLDRLVLAAPGAAASWQFELTRSDLMKFWRAAKPLRDYA